MDFTLEDLAAMKRGSSQTVRRGPYVGGIVSVDHIVPRAIAPELDNVIANLEFMPLKLNQGKGVSVGERQMDVARRLHAAGLLSDVGFQLLLEYLEINATLRNSDGFARHGENDTQNCAHVILQMK